MQHQHRPKSQLSLQLTVVLMLSYHGQPLHTMVVQQFSLTEYSFNNLMELTQRLQLTAMEQMQPPKLTSTVQFLCQY